MFSNLSGIGRAYRKLPPHHNFTELASNVEALAYRLWDRSLGSFGGEGYLKAPKRWEHQLAQDLLMLVEYARASVPPDTDGLHYFSGRGHTKPSRPTHSDDGQAGR